MKKTKPTKPLFVLDITNCGTQEELLTKLAFAKVNAKLPITMEEFKAAVSLLTEESVSTIMIVKSLLSEDKNTTACKKPNFFKRIWNKITRKNK